MTRKKLKAGKKTFIECASPANSYAVVFEDDTETGYFYALDNALDDPILDAVHIYNVDSIADREIPSIISIVWNQQGDRAGLLINDYPHAVFDFAECRGYCRNDFPTPSKGWGENHAWSDDVYTGLLKETET